MLSSESGETDKVSETIAECARIGIPVLPPDVNESYSQFTVVKEEKKEQAQDILSQGPASEPAGSAPPSHSSSLAPRVPEKVHPVPDSSTSLTTKPVLVSRIRFGLVTIKNFGQGIATAIIDERKRGGKFISLADFLDRVRDRNLNKKSLEALIKSGALDCFGEDRGVMFANIDRMLEYNKESGARHSDQDSLFGLMADHSSVPTLRMNEAPKADQRDKLAWEKELLGLYVSGHPLDRFRDLITKKDIDIKRALATLKDETSIILPVIISEIRTIQTKNNETMAFLTISDFSGSSDAVVFPRTYRELREFLVQDACLAVKAVVNTRNGEKSFVIERAKKL